MPRKSIKFSFPNGRGQMLAGVFDLPTRHAPLYYGVFAPCFTCTKQSHAAAKVCRILAENGVGMLRFDLTGLGESEGDFADTNFSTRILDIIAACKAVDAEFEPPKLLVGHSISGTAALSAVKQLPSIQLLATVGSPQDPRYIIDKLRRLKHLDVSGADAEMTIAGHKIIVRKSFIDDVDLHDVEVDTANLPCKLVVFHAPNDTTVDFTNAEEIFARARGDKELVPLSPTATHFLDNGTEDAAMVVEVLLGAMPL
jgi:putative redox protein